MWSRLAIVCWILTLVACSAPTQTAPVAGEAITCHTAYRAGVGQPISREEVLVLDAPGTQSRATFDDLVLLALYSTGEGEGGRALALRVMPVEGSDPIAAQLYQLAPTQTPLNEFVGGHGFTGLAYAYHPVSGAELQYWCVAGRER